MFNFDDHTHQDFTDLIARYEEMIHNNEKVFFDENTFSQLIDYYEDISNFEIALRVTELAIEQYPYSPIYLIKKAQFLFDLRQFDQALIELEQALVLDPLEITAILLKADIFTWLGNYTEAIQIIEEFITISDKEDIPDLYLELADIYEEWGKYDEVFNCMKKTLNINFDNQEALNRIWFCVEFTGKYDESIILHNQIIDKDAYSNIAWFNLAHAYSGLGLFEKAIDAFEMAIAINDEFEYAYKDAADIYFRQKKYLKAADYYLKITTICKPYKELYINIGDCYDKLNEPNKSRSYYRKALTIDPYSDVALFKIGLAYFKEKKYENALNSFEKAYKLNNRPADYLRYLAQTYRQLEHGDKAMLFYKKLITHHQPKKSVWVEAATVFFECLEYRLAFDTLESAAKLYINNAEFYYIKSAWYYQIGNRNEALLNLEIGLMKNWKKFKTIFKHTAYMKEDPIILHLIEQYKK